MKNWKQIRDYNYEASEDGEIKNIKTGRILKQRITKYGYPIVDIMIDKKRKTFKTHRLIVEVFHGEGLEGYQVDHINRKRDDNRASNLRWVTPKENIENREFDISLEKIERIVEYYKNGKTTQEIYSLINK